jgi:tetratricopeptide (TPR) repeat protein
LSAKTDKLIESATKFIVKGQIDRAIREYEQVVSIDPNDLRSRQKLAELLVKVNRKQDAIAEFENIGKYYANNSYHLKAIAVYTQVQRLDPKNISVLVTLAQLNVNQGLEGNAIQKFNEALTAYEREGDSDQVGKVLDCMLAAFPENPTVRLKAAEYRLKIGKSEESYQEYASLALILHGKGNELAFQQVVETIKQHFPERTDFFLTLGESLLNKGDGAGALKLLQQAIEQDRQNQANWEVYLTTLQQAGQHDQLQQAYNEMLLLFPDSPLPGVGIISCAIDGGRHDEALRLLIDLRAKLIATGCGVDLEESYRRLADALPGDLRVFEGQRDLFGVLGKASEQAAAEAKIAGLTGKKKTAPEAPPPEPGPIPEPQPMAAPKPVPTAPAAPPPTPVSAAPPPEWEIPADELDLDLSSIEGGESFEIEATSLVEPSPKTSPAASPEAAADYSVNWDSEGLDLGEIELVGLPLEGLETATGNATLAVEKKKKGQGVRVGEELDDSDSETHYSLGIAYKEMGLHDEAVKSFAIAARSPSRKVDCMTLQGLCMLDKGDLVAAEEAFVRVLKLAATPAELLCARFELAGLQERKGNAAEALRLYKEVAGVDADYCDVSKKIAALGKSPAGGYLSDQLLDLVLDHDD